MPTLFDIHSHLNFAAFKDDADEVARRTVGSGVWTIVVGSQSTTSQRALNCARKYLKGIYAAVGLHPIHLGKNYFDPNEEFGLKKPFHTKAEKFDFNFYKELAQDKKVVAIGECGLDYFHAQDLTLLGKQKEAFIKQIELALEIKKPLMIHCRKAHKDALDILRYYFLKRESEFNGNIHFFSGSLREAENYLELGFTVSFTGVITLTKNYDEIIREVPLEKIMIETDAPYVAPVPYRGRRNEPIYVAKVAKKIAEIRNLTFKKVAQITTKNALNYFKIGS
jgi:TatD DNase family protein